MEQRLLFERLGGSEAIAGVVDDFVARCAGDSRINDKFVRADIPRFKKILVDHVTEAAGGPATYTGRDMKPTHDGMGVTGGELEAPVEDRNLTLEPFSVPAAEQQELLGIPGSLRGDIVEVESPETGTPLPDTYRSAPPLVPA